MGAAQSSNAATAIANVATFVHNSTKANSNAVSKVLDSFTYDNCYIKLDGDFNNKASATLAQTNSQIVSAKNDTNLNNNIQQQMLQQANSTVGTLGIGYADASNSVSTTVNDTNQVINAMTVGSSQYSAVDQKFQCTDSTIIAKNLNIGFSSGAEFLSSQTLNNDQVASVVNDISQTIQQKATATVEGISAMLLLLLLMIAIIVYVAMKPLSSGSVKIIVGVLACVLVFVIIGYMYLRGTPPFFSNLDQCINNSSLGMGGESQCVDLHNEKITLKTPPLKYIYGITPSNNSQPGGNLVQMAIAAVSGQSLAQGGGSNGGYRGDTYQSLDSILNSQTGDYSYTSIAESLNIPMIPNPLYLPQPNNNSYYLIPGQFSGNDPDNGDNALCTPGTVQVGDNSGSTNLSSCPRVAAPSVLGTTQTLSDSIANLNSQAWSDYLSLTGSYPPRAGFNGDEGKVRALFARFVLCDIIGSMDLHYYIDPEDIVKFSPQNSNQVLVGQAKNFTSSNSADIYFYHPYSYPGNWSNGVIGPGYITGQVGYVNNTSYRYQKFMRNIGGYILLAVFICILGYLFYSWYKNRNKEETKMKPTIAELPKEKNKPKTEPEQGIELMKI